MFLSHSSEFSVSGVLVAANEEEDSKKELVILEFVVAIAMQI